MLAERYVWVIIGFDMAYFVTGLVSSRELGANSLGIVENSVPCATDACGCFPVCWYARLSHAHTSGKSYISLYWC